MISSGLADRYGVLSGNQLCWGQTRANLAILYDLPKFKLLGGTNQWDNNTEMKRKAALAVIACIATLYISSEAPDLVKSHMVGVDGDRKNHMITYSYEPEAVLEVLSENDVKRGILMELDAVNKFSGIL